MGEVDLDLLHCIAEYAYRQGSGTMVDISHGLGDHFQLMAWDQDAIGWWRFMEEMICTWMHWIQSLHHYREGTHLSPKRWARSLIVKLLEATHGQWIYRNIQIHNLVAGTQATLWKEEIQREIEKQMELGMGGLLEEDHWMMEVILEDMVYTLGEQEEYWLVAVKAAWEAAALTRQGANQTQEKPAANG